MGIVNLKVTVGTVGFTDWLHVTACKVSAPSTVVWEDWIDVPVASHNFIIPNLDPENYYVRYYDAPTNSSLGTIKLELLVNALSGETISERRFYTVGGAGAYDPADGDTGVTDPYLVNKNIKGVFKESFRYYEPLTEFTNDPLTGNVDIINGTTLTTDEKLIIEIEYRVANTPTVTPTGLYNGILNVPEATKTLTAGDIEKRVRLVGSAATQVITLCALSAIAADKGFYFDNTCGGTAIQVKLLIPGSDRIRFNGFMAASNLFAEFWISKGEHLLIRKFDDSYWEVITDYKGVDVGNRQSGSYVNMPAYHAEDGSLSDGDEYCRVWWWINNILPSSHVITDDAVTDPGYSYEVLRMGQFVKHSTLKKFRWPRTMNMSERGLKDFNTYAGDAERTYDYPMAWQGEMVGPHSHGYNPGDVQGLSDNANDRQVMVPGSQSRTTLQNAGTENRVDNIGVIYMVHI